MVPEQTIQKLNWLDEEHRRDRAAIADLNSKIDTYLAQINGLTKGLQDLEERLARVQGQALRYSQVESALAQLKTEVNIMFEQAERRAQQREGEYLQVRTLDRDRLDKAVEALSAKIEELGQNQRFIQGDHDALKRIESGQIAFIRGIEELSKRIESLNGRTQVAEEWVRRSGALIAELQQIADRLRQDRADALEAMRRSDQARSRQVTEWNEQMKVQRREMEDWVAQLRPLLELPKETRGYLALLRELETQLKQIEPRLTQRQKLNEEFMRKELDTMKQDLAKREEVTQREWEFMRDDWSKKIAAIATRFDPIDEWRPQVMDEFRELRERMDADRLRIMTVLADIVRMQVEYGRGSNARYEQYASDLITRVENERASAKVKKPAPPARPADENL
jgi:chromosome segregation ATPase